MTIKTIARRSIRIALLTAVFIIALVSITVAAPIRGAAVLYELACDAFETDSLIGVIRELTVDFIREVRDTARGFYL